MKIVVGTNCYNTHSIFYVDEIRNDYLNANIVCTQLCCCVYIVVSTLIDIQYTYYIHDTVVTPRSPPLYSMVVD